jgi:hypothetical protein
MPDFTTVMRKDDLLAKVRENRQNHIDMRQEALDGFRREAEAELKKTMGLLREMTLDKCPKDVSVRLYPPQDHTKDYDQAIRMLEATIAEEVALESYDFARLVEDDWSWTEGWVTHNKKFSSSVSSYAAGKGL